MQQAEDKMARGTLNHKNTLVGGLSDQIVQIHVSEFTSRLFTSQLRIDIKREEITDFDSMAEKQLSPNMWKSERKRILSESLESHFTPRSHFPSCMVW